MVVLRRACAAPTNCGVCGHTRSERCLMSTWVSVELQKAVAIGYVIVAIYEAWNYDETTVYDQATCEWGLFAQYMNTFMKIKTEVSGYPVGCTIPQGKTVFIVRVCAHEGISLGHDDILYNAGRRTVAKLGLNNIWGKYAQNPDRCTKEFATEPRKFLNSFLTTLIMYLTYNDNQRRLSIRHVQEVERVSNACAKRHHSRQTRVVQRLEDRTLYCDTTRSYTDTWLFSQTCLKIYCM